MQSTRRTIRGKALKEKLTASQRIRAAIEGLEDRTLFNSLVWSDGPALPTATGNAAVINSGNLYVIGGTTVGGATAGAYGYDPNTGQWTAALALDQSRSGAGVGFTGVGLTKYASEVFVYGGTDGTQATSSAISWAYSTAIDGDTVNAPSMGTPRRDLAYATDAATGDLFAIGGRNGSVALASAEIYNPTADAWSRIAPLPQALYSATAAVDGVGHIFVFGGDNSAGHPVNTVYRYTIDTNSWDTMGAMPFAASGVGAVYSTYGQIYVAGGQTAAGPTAKVEWYNPVLDSWTDETPLPSAVSGAAVALDSYGNVDVIGGFNGAGNPVPTFYTSPVGPAPQGLPVPPTINFRNTWDYYNGQAEVVTPTAYASDGVTPAAGSLSITYNGSTTPPTNAGTYQLLATFTSADPNYTNTVATSTLYIAPANPTITLTGGGTFTFDANPHPASATVVGIDGMTAPAGSLAITYNGSTTPPVNGGTYAVVATFTSTDPNYATTTASTTITIPDPTIVTGVGSVGVTPTSFTVFWNPVPAALPISGYEVYRVTVAHSPRGSGATIYHTGVAFTTGTSVTFTVGAGIAPYYYVVSSVSPTGVASPYSAEIGAQVAYAPSISGMLVGGGFVAWGTVEAGQTLTASLAAYGNPYPTFTKLSGPSTLSIDPTTSVITYSPTAAEVGTQYATFQATNSQGSVTITCEFKVQAIPTVAVTGGTFTFDGNTHGATAVAYGSDGVTPVAGTISLLYNGISTAPYAQAGTWSVFARFTSSDPNYGGATGTGVVVINPATPTLNISGGTFPLDGSPHPATVSAVGVDGISSVSGTTSITYNGSTSIPTTPGTYNVAATFTSADGNYANAMATTTLTILSSGVQVTPMVLVSSDTITYDGQPHGASRFVAVGADGTTPVNGTYTVMYNGSPNMPTDAGTYAVDVSFTSADANYTDATGSGTLTIDPANPTVSVANNVVVFDSNPHPATATAVGVDGVSAVAGTYTITYNGSSVQPTDVGTYTVGVTFTSGDANYVGATGAGTLTINPTTPTITLPNSVATFDGNPHSASATQVGVDGVTPVAGTLSYTYNGSSSAPTSAGTYSVVATFTSTDPNYATATATGSLTVKQASPGLSLNVGPYNYDGNSHVAVGSALGVDGVTPVAGTFSYTYGGSSTAPTNAGTYAVVATIIPADANYSAGSVSGSLTISPVLPVFGSLSSPSIVAGTASTSVGGTLAAGTLYPAGGSVLITINRTTATATISSTGTFSTSFPTAALAASATPYAITYSYAGSTNFAAASGAGLLTVTPSPVVVTQSPLSQTVLGAKTVTFTAAATATPLPTVQWQVSIDGGTTWKNITGATRTTYSLVSSASLNGNEYRAAFTSGGFSVATAAATLTVNTVPVVTTSPKSQTVVAGTTVSLTAAASGNPSPIVQWQQSTDAGKTWANISGATARTLSFTAAASENGYRYRAVFTSSVGTVTTASAAVTVQFAPTVTTNPISQSVAPGKSVTFAAAASANPAATVRWQVSTNGGTTWTNISGATRTSYSVTPTLAQNGYQYRAIFTNSLGSITTSAATLTT